MFIGIDLGSRTTNLAVVEKGTMVDSLIINSGRNPVAICEKLLMGRRYTGLAVTGYGRHLAGEKLAAKVISEIKAYALGARTLFPGCRTVIDVGGQDCKVIALDKNGIMKSFEMNDRCAAGTGRFLEVMAGILDLPVEEFGQQVLTTNAGVKINSTCTVFAESEVISLINSGESSVAIARGLHQSIARRISQMVGRIGLTEPVVFAGGGAKNVGLVALVEAELGVSCLIFGEPQLVGAYGAALAVEKGYKV
ncbi:MAG: 3-hydroxyacyl-ACP dehydratase [Clostridia bacterium]|nr:3-hydroxyacyl-ACP dehydratase [Clostridia bacterium]